MVVLSEGDSALQSGELIADIFRFVEAAGLRVVGIENKIRSLKALSQTLLNAAVLQTVEDNGGKRYNTEHLRARMDGTVDAPRQTDPGAVPYRGAKCPRAR